MAMEIGQEFCRQEWFPYLYVLERLADREKCLKSYERGERRQLME